MTRTDRTHGEKYKERLWATYLNLTICMNFIDFILNQLKDQLLARINIKNDGRIFNLQVNFYPSIQILERKRIHLITHFALGNYYILLS